MADTIRISTVLSEIRHNPQPFSLEYIAADGSRRIFMESVSLSGPGKSEGEPQTPANNPKAMPHYQRNHLLPLYNNLGHHPFQVRIALLTYFNGLRILHHHANQ